MSGSPGAKRMQAAILLTELTPLEQAIYAVAFVDAFREMFDGYPPGGQIAGCPLGSGIRGHVSPEKRVILQQPQHCAPHRQCSMTVSVGESDHLISVHPSRLVNVELQHGGSCR